MSILPHIPAQPEDLLKVEKICDGTYWYIHISTDVETERGGYMGVPLCRYFLGQQYVQVIEHDDQIDEE